LQELAAWTGGTGVVPVYQKPGRRKAARDEDDEEDGAAGEREDGGPDGADDDEHRAGDDALGDGEPADAAARGARGGDPRGAGGRGEGQREPRAGAGAAGPTPPPRARVVLVDHALPPPKQRTRERAPGADVLDRPSVIREISPRHARTREARLQVEIARLKY